jgi:hypothetical protein
MPTPTCVSVSFAKGRTGSFSVLNSGSATEEETYRVVFDGVGSTAQMAMVASDGTNSVPGFNQVLGVLVLTTKSAEQRSESPLEWTVKCTYTMQQPGQQSKPDDPDVEKWAITANGDSVPYETEIFKKPDGTWISNTAGDLINGVMETLYDEEITFEYTTTSVPFTDLDACKGRANNADIVITMNGESVTYVAGTLKLDAYSYTYTRDVNGEQYPRIKLRFLFRGEGWVRKVPNMGYRKLTDDGPMMIDPDAPQPFPLTADGTDKLDVTDAVLTVDVPPREADFTSLLSGLDT